MVTDGHVESIVNTRLNTEIRNEFLSFLFHTETESCLSNEEAVSVTLASFRLIQVGLFILPKI